MFTVLLWNVQRKPMIGLLDALARAWKVDILLLVEDGGGERVILSDTSSPLNPFIVSDRFGVYCRFNPSRLDRLMPPVPDDRIELLHLRAGVPQQVLFALVHGHDRRNTSEGKRSLFFSRVVENVAWAEGQVGHRRTLVAGDFNANPFDASIGSVRGLHALPIRDVAGRNSRNILGRSYDIFYNPMWGCYGDRAGNPPATYYHYNYEEHELFWHMLDQVVLRPSLLSLWSEGDCRILDRAGNQRLLTPRGIPDSVLASDHLPILFRLRLRRPRRF